MNQNNFKNEESIKDSLIESPILIYPYTNKKYEGIIKKRTLPKRITLLKNNLVKEIYKKNVVIKKYPEELKNKTLIEKFRYYLENNPIIINDSELLVGGIFLKFSNINMDFKAGNIYKNMVGDSYFSTGVEGYSVRSPPGYHNIIKLGFAGIRDKSIELLKSEKDAKKRKFLQNSAKAHDLGCKFISEYEKQALKKAKDEKNLQRKEELLKIGRVCHNLSIKAPSNFYEGIQLVWFTKIFGAVGCIGRFDQYLGDLLEKDLKQDKIDHEQALELLEDFWIKCNTITQEWAASHDSLQNMVVGGQKPNGEDATNSLTYMCLQALYDLKLLEPKLGVRFCDNSPIELINETCKVLRLGMGMPAIYNDNIAVPALVKLDIPIEDARDYCNNGCSELIINGKSTTCFIQINLLSILNKILKENKNGFKNFGELLKLYKKRIKKEIYAPKVNPLIHPFFAPTMDDCLIEASLNVRYIIQGCIANATANAADGLAAIKKIVFEDETISWNQLIKAIESNFDRDYKSIKQILINKAPKFGNDEKYVDLITKDIAEYFCDCVLENSYNQSGKGIKFAPGLLAYDVDKLKDTNASADGRKKGENIANGIGPGLGRDVKGPTAIINSVANIDCSKASYGSVLDLVFYSSLFDQQTIDKFIDFVKTFLQYPSTSTLHINFLNKDLLKAAQQNPSNPLYKNIIVRVWGFSTYFVDLDKDLQNHIIERTEQK